MTGGVDPLTEVVNFIGNAAQFERDGRAVGIAERFTGTVDCKFAGAVDKRRDASERAVCARGTRNAIVDIGTPCRFVRLRTAELGNADSRRRIIGCCLKPFLRRNIRLPTGNTRSKPGLARNVGVDAKAQTGHLRIVRALKPQS